MDISRSESAKIIIHNYFNRNEITKDRLETTAAIIKGSGYIQIDSIARVQRAHHHTLFARDHRYKPELYEQLLSNKRIFEGWGHAMSILPMQDYRFHQRRMELFSQNPWYKSTYPKIKKIIPVILDKIKSEGAVSSLDFPSGERVRGGWNTIKLTKLALHLLHLQGKLMVVQRRNFRKYYDLPERALPSNLNTKNPTSTEIAEYVVDKALENLTIASQKEIAEYLQIIDKAAISKVLLKKEASGDIEQIKIGENPKKKYWMNGRHAKGNINENEEKLMRILSPFDNILINRIWLEDIFDFYYRLECYLPVAKRRFGFFSLPLLYDYSYVGLMDCTSDKADNLLRINNLHIEEKYIKDGEFRARFHQELRAFSDFNTCDTIVAEDTLSYPIKTFIKETLNDRY